MGRSQRHMILEQGADATGASIGQGVIAPGLLAQAEGEVEYGDELRGIEGIEVPVGPPGGPLQGSTLTGAIPADVADGGGTDPNPEPEPGMEPTLTSLDPNTVEKDSANIVMSCRGTNFTDSSVIVFAGVDEPTTFVSPEEITTGVTPSLGWGTDVGIPVHVRQGTYETAPLDFIFTSVPEADATKSKSKKGK